MLARPGIGKQVAENRQIGVEIHRAGQIGQAKRTAHPALTAHARREMPERQQCIQLAAEPEQWQAIRPLMRADSDAVFAALRDSFVEGIPQPLDKARIDALQRLLILSGAKRTVVMPAALFQSEP